MATPLLQLLSNATALTLLTSAQLPLLARAKLTL